VALAIAQFNLETTMNDLVSLFRNFIYRDLAFILGGSIVLVSTLHAFGRSLHSLQDQPYTLFLLIVLAYVVGYAVQDFGAVLFPRLIFTGYVFEPRSFWQRPYRRFTGATSWRPLNFAHNQEEALQFAIQMDRRNIPKATLRDLERIRSLKVISMCVGACSLVSAIIFLITFLDTFVTTFLIKWAFSLFTFIDLIAAVPLVVFGLALICLGWVKALQEMQFYEAVNAEEYPLRKEQERTTTNNAH
jgi:hypothetical protein